MNGCAGGEGYRLWHSQGRLEDLLPEAREWLDWWEDSACAYAICADFAQERFQHQSIKGGNVA
jgi:hypothetical protein